MDRFMKELNERGAATLLVSGLFLALLGGCSGSLVDVAVTVDTCAQGPRPPIAVQPPEGGGCWQGSAITSPISATGAYIANTSPGDYITADEGRTCTSGNRFGGGSCNFIPCVWKFTPSPTDPKKGSCTTACRWW
jgi:hypothetical protein